MPKYINVNATPVTIDMGRPTRRCITVHPFHSGGRVPDDSHRVIEMPADKAAQHVQMLSIRLAPDQKVPATWSLAPAVQSGKADDETIRTAKQAAIDQLAAQQASEAKAAADKAAKDDADAIARAAERTEADKAAKQREADEQAARDLAAEQKAIDDAAEAAKAATEAAARAAHLASQTKTIPPKGGKNPGK